MTYSPLDKKSVGTTSAQRLSEKTGDSQPQIYRYIRLTYLLPALLQMVDENKLVLRPAVELSYLTQEEQALLLEVMGRLGVVPTLEQAQRLKTYSQDGQLTAAVMDAVLADRKPAAVQVTLKKDRLKQYFPQSYTQKQMEDVIFSLLEGWKSQQKGGGTGDKRDG